MGSSTSQRVFLVVFSVCLVVLALGKDAHGAQMEMINQTVTVQSGIELNVIFSASNVSNFEAGQQIVLLHGFPEGWYGWIDLIPELLNLNNYSFVVPDMPGFNRSQTPSDLSGYEVSSLADDVASLILHTGAPVTLIGHDWGGVVAWVFANRYPQLLNGLVILNSPNPSVWWELIQSDPAQQNASSYIWFFVSSEGFPTLSANNFAELAAAFSNEPWFAPREDIYFSAWSRDLNSSLNYYRANIYGGSSGDWSGWQTALPLNCTVDVPTLVLWGLNDPVFALPENLDNLSKFVPNLQVETFPNGTHWIHHDIPQVLAPYIDNFISQNTNSTSGGLWQ